MATVPVGFTVCTATLTCAGSLRPCVITMAVGGSGGISASTIHGLWRAGLSTSGSSPFAAVNMDEFWTLVNTKATKYLAGDALELAESSTAIVGTLTLSTPSPNVSVLVAKRTAFGGRRYRGRLSAPPANISEGSITPAGIIDGTALALQQGYWNYVYNSMVTGGANPYLIHYPTPLPDGGDFPPAPTAITALVVSPLVGSNGSRIR